MDVRYEDIVDYICSEEGCPGSIGLSKMLPSPEGMICLACRKGHYIKYEKPKFTGWGWTEIDGGFVAGNHTCLGVVDKNL
jgi:hypothetical protein